MKRLYLFLIGTVLCVSVLRAQRVYCFVGKHFCNFDLKSGEEDTLFSFHDYPSGWGFRSCIDQYNGRYFFGGSLPGYEGNFHIIDLVELKIQSFKLANRPEDMEYDFLHNRIVFEDNGTLYEIPLHTTSSDTVELHTISVVETGNSTIWGQKRTYIPQTDQFVYVDFINGSDGDPYYLVIDGHTGNLECQEVIETYQNNFYYPAGLVTNNITGEIIAHHEGRFGFVDPCEASMTKQTDIPIYISHLNCQMAVYNHNDHTYIIPFLNGFNDYDYLMAIIDVETDKLLEIRNQPFGGAMNLQEIYDKPVAPLIYLRDTLFVPKGEYYEWFRDGESIGQTLHNYHTPTVSGTYKAHIIYREYETYSTEAEIVLSSAEMVSPFLIKMFPNPVADYLTIDNYHRQIKTVEVMDAVGHVWYAVDQAFDLPEQIVIDMSMLQHGVYSVYLQLEEGLFSKQIIKI